MTTIGGIRLLMPHTIFRNMKKPISSSAKQPLFEPWVPPLDTTAADVHALKALASGTANDAQQIRALKFIVEQLAGTYEMSFTPGADGPYVTAFCEGKRRVGTMIVSYLKADVSKFEEEPSMKAMPSASVINKAE